MIELNCYHKFVGIILPLCLQPPNKSAQVQLPAKSDAPWYLLPDESGQKQGSGTKTRFKSANL